MISTLLIIWAVIILLLLIASLSEGWWESGRLKAWNVWLLFMILLWPLVTIWVSYILVSDIRLNRRSGS